MFGEVASDGYGVWLSGRVGGYHRWPSEILYPTVSSVGLQNTVGGEGGLLPSCALPLTPLSLPSPSGCFVSWNWLSAKKADIRRKQSVRAACTV